MKAAFAWFSAAAALAAACLAGFWLGQETPAAPPAPAPAAAARRSAKPAPVMPPAAAAPAPGPAAPLAIDLEAHGRALAAQGIDAALAFLKSLQDPNQQTLFLRGVFQHAATLGVEQALAWAQDLDQNHRETALLTLLQQWSGIPASVEGQETPPAALRLGVFLLQSQRATPEQVLPLANGFLSGDPRAQLLALVADAMFAAGADPATALALGQGLEGKAERIFLARLATSWAAKDANAARAWATTIPNEELRIEMLAQILEVQSQSDIASALESLNSLPADHPRRIAAARHLAARWGSQNPSGAQQWLESLPPGAERDAVARGIADLSPVGIGVAIGQADSDGYFPIRHVLPDGIAGRTKALRPGDRIVAITDANGAWLSLRDRSLQEIVDLIRGPEGSTVSMQ
ncbi:MAG TPA: PDZ domain-containing protein, partial [Prosthecobacter sp.]|nr:PDZ domain-containing protein [Prosthecobacter sp.]